MKSKSIIKGKYYQRLSDGQIIQIQNCEYYNTSTMIRASIINRIDNIITTTFSLNYLQKHYRPLNKLQEALLGEVYE